MKKIGLILIIVLIIACSVSYIVVNRAEKNKVDTFEDVMVFDNDIGSLTIADIEYDVGSEKYVVDYIATNKTDKTLLFYFKNATIDDYIVDGHMYVEVSAESDHSGKFDIYSEDASMLKTIEHFTFDLEIYESKTWEKIDISTYTINF